MPSKTPAADRFEMGAALDRIAAYVPGMDEAGFLASRVCYDAALMNLINIGEAANRLPTDLTAREPSIPWGDVIGLRNRVAHGYGDIEPKRIWTTIQTDLPPLRATVERLLRAFGPPR